MFPFPPFGALGEFSVHLRARLALASGSLGAPRVYIVRVAGRKDNLMRVGLMGGEGGECKWFEITVLSEYLGPFARL